MYCKLQFNLTVIEIHLNINYIWRPSSLSELTPIMFNMGLTHLGSEASICDIKYYKYEYVIIIIYYELFAYFLVTI